MVVYFVGTGSSLQEFDTANARSGRAVVMAHISLPTLEGYVSCIFFASCVWCLGSGSPLAALNFLYQVGLVGSGVVWACQLW
jgi:hypothetical protein